MKTISEKIKSIALELTGIKSVVGSKGEIVIAERIYEILKQLDYFKQNPQNVMLCDLKNDKLGRKNVVAYIEAEKYTPETILLLGHIDTVGIDDYGELKQFATKPELLKREFGQRNIGAEIIKDVESDNWIFGRGLFDMKYGVAALTVMMEQFGNLANKINGNIVFIAVPDEEGDSGGMLSAVQTIAELADEKSWEFVAAIDADYMTDAYPGDEKKYVYVGTVGKLLPSFYVFGKETHVGQAFDGFDANLLASKIVSEINLKPDLSDIVDGEVTQPPVSLYQRDLKAEYSVQTAHEANMYMNFATHSVEPGTVLEILKEKTKKAFEDTIECMNTNYKEFCEISDIPFENLPWKVNVLTFEELYSNVRGEMGKAIDDKLNCLVEELLSIQEMDEREFSLRVIQEVHKYYSNRDPIVVIYFNPPYYPHIYVKGETEREQRLLKAINSAVDETKAVYNYEIEIKKFYPYISDLSFCGIAEGEQGVDRLIDNMPAWPKKYRLPVEAIRSISMPVVNIGPYGRDAHKLTERLSKAYSFDAMPMLLYKTINNLIGS